MDRRQAIAVMSAASAGLALECGTTRASAAGPTPAAAPDVGKTPDAAPPDVLRHGAYVCLQIAPDARDKVAHADIGSLVERHGFANEFDASAGHPARAIAFLKRVGAAPGQIDDPALQDTEAIVHVAASDAALVETACTELIQRVSVPNVRVLRGVVRPTVYTSNTLQDFAYARQAVQQPGQVMPNAFLIPMTKAPEWWAKHWMERHTYFLPRYDDSGRMLHEGHALAAAAGIPSIVRRTYKSEVQPAPEGAYEFVNYFECADKDLSTFEAIVAALRDVNRNPEWSFVREGPTWRGRQVRGWSDLFE